MKRRAASSTGIAAVVAVSLAACGWQGAESLPVPGGAGRGSDAYTVTIEMPDVTTITVNSPVLVNDVESGRITAITLKGWHADVTVALNADVDLPRNATAVIGQTSLLGSQHIQLAGPPAGIAPVGRLAAGDTIGLPEASQYPTTEQTLAAVSLILNGGGLAQVSDIVHGANAMLDGRTDKVAGLLRQLTDLTATIDRRRDSITTALRGLDHIGRTVAAQNAELDAGIKALAPALAQLASRRSQLNDALTALDRFATSARNVVVKSGNDLESNIANVGPVLRALADTGSSLTRSLDLLFTLPIPVSRVDRVVRGDFANLYALLDFSVPRMRSDLLRGTPLGTTLAGPTGALGRNAGAAGDRADPRTGPLGRPQVPRPPGAPRRGGR